MPLPSLPIEVIENVVDQATCDTRTLRNFALACRELLPRSRYHLFHSIRFGDMIQLYSFYDFLDLHPHVGSFVISLTLSATQGNLKSLSLLQVIPTPLLTKLPKLCMWKIIGPETRRRKPRQWLSFTSPALTCLRVYGTAIVKLSLDSVSLPNCAHFVQYIQAFRGLKFLHCRSLHFRKRLHGSRLSWIKQHLAKKFRLATLIIDRDVPDDAVLVLLESSHSTLLDLDLYVPKSTQLNIPAIISQLHGLHSFTLTLEVRQWDGSNKKVQGEYILRTFQIIKALSPRPQSHLRKLIINLRDCTESIPRLLHPVLNPHLYPALECCRELEATLLHLSSLRNIEVHYDGPPRGIDLFEEYLPILARERSVTFKNLMPSCHRRGSHDDWVQAIAISPDNQRIASGSRDYTIILWDAQRRSIVHEWIAHSDDVISLAFSPNSRRLASTGHDRRLMVWDISDSRVKRVAILEGHAGEVNTCAWSPDGALLVSGSVDRTIRIWDASTYQQLHSLRDPSGARVQFVRFSPDGRWIASGGANPSCAIWDAKTADLHATLNGHSKDLHNAVFDLATGRIATASDDGTIRIWVVETGEVLVVLEGHTEGAADGVTDVAFSQDGRRVASGSKDGTIKVWDSFSGGNILSLEAHTTPVHVVCFSPDGKYVASASQDRPVQLWRVSDGICIRTFTEHSRKVECLVYSSDGETLISGGRDGKVCIRHLCDAILDEHLEAEGLV